MIERYYKVVRIFGGRRYSAIVKSRRLYNDKSLIGKLPLKTIEYKPNEWTNDEKGIGIFVFNDLQTAIMFARATIIGRWEIWQCECRDRERPNLLYGFFWENKNGRTILIKVEILLRPEQALLEQIEIFRKVKLVKLVKKGINPRYKTQRRW